MSNYTEADIVQMDGVDWILYAPHNHIGTTDSYGQFHIFKEVLDNSIDEVEQENVVGSNILVYLFMDSKTNKYTTIVRDDGRGVPLRMTSTIFTNLYTTGKSRQSLTVDRKKKDTSSKSYKASAGQNGIGTKVSMALSQNFKVISHREKQTATLTTKNAKTVQDIIEKSHQTFTGTMVALEPRYDIFSEIDVFIRSGYEQIVNLCRFITMFSQKAKITIKIFNKNIDKKFWNMTGDEALDFIEATYGEKWITVIDGNDHHAGMRFLLEKWALEPTTNFIWSLENVERFMWDNKEEIGYKINLFLPKILRTTNIVSLVNNVVMRDNTSSNITGLLTCVKNKLVPFLEGKEKQLIEYFLQIYKLPICIAMSLKYPHVRFTTLSKDGFKSKEFEKDYIRLLSQDLDKQNPIFFQELYNHIEKDIETKYALYYNKPLTTKKSRKNLSIEIGTKFHACGTTDKNKAELYIVEGLSADHIVTGRDPDTQAVYCIFGKPKNTIRNAEGSIGNITAFNNYEPYKNLSKLLNIDNKFFDPEQLQYSKIIILNDADIDGAHIRSLHISNMLTLNPQILSTGMVYLANPPLYEVSLSNSKTDKRFYIQDKKAFIHFCIRHLYYEAFELAVSSPGVYERRTLTDEEDYAEFCEIIICIGEILNELSIKLAIPSIIIEKLTYATQYINGTVNVEGLKSIFGEGIRYYPETNVLYIPTRDEDVVFSLTGVAEALYEELMPVLHKFSWKKLEIYITTKLSDVFNHSKISIAKLYQLFIQVNDILQVTRQKGLGGMDVEDLLPICLNPETRVLHRITCIGDIERIVNLMGDDVTVRKQILMDRDLL